MTNNGVCCNVNECMYHKEDDKCTLDKIQVSHEKTSADSIAIPHFCKSYEKKQSSKINIQKILKFTE